MTTPKNGIKAVDVAAPKSSSVALTTDEPDEAVHSAPEAAASPASKMPQTAEEEITQAIQVLSNLATLKLKTQESKDQSLEVLRKIESLFKLEEPISPQDLDELKSGFKTLNKFALAVNQYYETKTKAEEAKKVLDAILGSFRSSAN
jgi:3-oxoacyl-ACP reductase-like protein